MGPILPIIAEELQKSSDADPAPTPRGSGILVRQKVMVVSAPVKCECRCGKCCESLIIEATEADARREAKIQQFGQRYRDMAGYLLNAIEAPHHCIFFTRDDQQNGVCTIYETRPSGCRTFNCDGKGREQLINLGIIDPRCRAQPPQHHAHQ